MQIRARWPKTRILLRADFGFAREALMGWCERTGSTSCSAWRATAARDEIAAELANAEEEFRGAPANRPAASRTSANRRLNSLFGAVAGVIARRSG